MSEWGLEEVEEFFVLEVAGEEPAQLRRYFGDAEAARRYALGSGGKLFRGHTALIRATLQEVPLSTDDAY